jgi:hypothetical protein
MTQGQTVTIQPNPSGGVTITQPPGPMRPLTSREMDAIRDRRNDISNQLTSAMDRRNDMIEEMSEAPASAQAGYLGQIQLLDQRIVAIERDMEESGRMLRTGLTVDNGTALVAPRETGWDSMSEDAQIATSLGVSVFFLLPLAIGIMRLMFRRARRKDAIPNQVNDARMERLEQAVDAIAIEIERVGESQRFQQKVLAEANMMPAMSHRAPEPVRVSDYSRDR